MSACAYQGIKHWVFLRGLGRERLHWGSFLERCQDELGWRCYAIDLPGCGDLYLQSSPVFLADIRRYVAKQTELIPEPFAVLGLSLGGMVALDWAAHYPERVLQAVLINSSSGLNPLWQRLRFQRWPALIGSAFVSASKREEMVLGWVSHPASPHSKPHSELSRWQSIQAARPVNISTVYRQLTAARHFQLPAPATLKASPIIFASKADELVHPACSQSLAEYYSTSVDWHPWAGHDLPLDDPDWLIQRLSNFSA